MYAGNISSVALSITNYFLKCDLPLILVLEPHTAILKDFSLLFPQESLLKKLRGS